MSQKKKQKDGEDEITMSTLREAVEQAGRNHRRFVLVTAGKLRDLKEFMRGDAVNMWNVLTDTNHCDNSYLMAVVLECKDSHSYQQRKAMIRFLVTKAPQLVTLKNKKGEIPLVVACKHALHPELINLLLQINPDTINEKDDEGKTLLHLVACVAGDTDKFANETPDPEVKRVRNSMFLSESDSDTEVVKVDNPPTKFNTIFNAVPIAEVLIKHGASVHAEDTEGRTVLQTLFLKEINYIHCPHFEVYKVQYKANIIKFMEVLLINGAHLYSSSGTSALSNVCSVESAKVMLKYHPEELNVKNYRGRTPLHQLMKRFSDCGDKTKILKFLIDNGAEVEEECDPIIIIRESHCDFEILEIFLGKTPGYDVNSTNSNGCTVLEQYGVSYKIVEKLLGLGADFSLTSNEYHSKALEFAHKNNDPELVMFLLENGVDPYLVTEDYSYFVYIEVLPATSFLQCIIQHFVSKQTGNVEEWRKVLKYYLELPQMRDETLPEELKTLYSQVLTHLVKLESINTENILEVLEQLFLSNKSINQITCTNIFELYIEYYETDNCEVEFCSIVFYLAWSKRMHGDEDKVLSFIKKMLDHGMCISNTPPNCLTIMTVTLFLLDTSRKRFFGPPDIKKEKLQHDLVDLFIERGVNVESCAFKLVEMFSKENFANLENFQSTYNIPDVLAISLLNEDQYHVDKFLPYWWAPPLLLLQLTYSEKEFREWFPRLIQYGGVPHGMPMYKHVSFEISSLFKQSDVSEENVAGWNTWKLVKDTPISLQECCKYKIRELVSTEAQQPSKSLPQVLNDLDLPPLLRNVVIH